jgi:hypothetical protein
MNVKFVSKVNEKNACTHTHTYIYSLTLSHTFRVTFEDMIGEN